MLPPPLAGITLKLASAETFQVSFASPFDNRRALPRQV
ncbi:hypothetical protein THTE_3984 [Thermogutta terrifontis]|uniref:Uncharacterized protein n=1 Tax=Thermogutta terrifontis TaxID=1331910 RepID=A0A286RKU2_9BACT|nr:hypothetical protein THTE_3984 [Thermogutta terrifontis]